ncbi:MAG TPA: pantoate--beta-alanine ligase [Thermoleophilia bacterium]
MTSRVTTISAVREAVAGARAAGKTVGLVPTMGALHEGHLSLMRRARTDNDLVVASIFVNPTQFGPAEDLQRYPRDLGRDLALAGGAGVDMVFAPEPGEMYPPGYATWVEVEGLGERLCGTARPRHFRGVTTVVAKLLDICRPDCAYFGLKDGQQFVIIRRMAQDLNLPVEIVGCPTIREPDGLAMSSRNVYLTIDERAQAPVIHRALRAAESAIAIGERDAPTLRRIVGDKVGEASLARAEYVEVVATEDLLPVARIQGECLIALAVWFGKTRLIDNIFVEG